MVLFLSHVHLQKDVGAIREQLATKNCGSATEGSLALRTEENNVASMSSSGVIRVGGLIAAQEELEEA